MHILYENAKTDCFETEDRVRAGRDHLAHRRARRDRDALVRAGRHLLLDGGLPVALAVLGVHLLV